MHRNVKLYLIYIALSTFSYSTIWGMFYSNFIYLVANSDESVGYAYGAYGILALIAAFPAGLLADKFIKSKLIRFFATIAILTNVIFLVSTFMANIIMIYITACIIGFSGTFLSAPLKALYSNSIQNGKERTDLSSKISIVTTIATTAGPLLSVVFFFFYSDQWKIVNLQIILCAGIIIAALSNIFLYFVVDINESEAEAESEAESEVDQETGLLIINQQSSPDLDRHRLYWLAPWILSLSDLLIASGSGMTLAYFPIYFRTVMNLEPIPVGLIYTICPLAISLIMLISNKLVRFFGRPVIIIMADLIGSCCMFGLHFNLPLYCIITLFILRTAMMQATAPIQEAVLMDAVNPEHRGKWSAVEGVTSFTWTGSALVGGFVVTYVGYKTTFLITSIIYALGSAVLLPLLWIAK